MLTGLRLLTRTDRPSIINLYLCIHREGMCYEEVSAPQNAGGASERRSLRFRAFAECFGGIARDCRFPDTVYHPRA